MGVRTVAIHGRGPRLSGSATACSPLPALPVDHAGDRGPTVLGLAHFAAGAGTASVPRTRPVIHFHDAGPLGAFLRVGLPDGAGVVAAGPPVREAVFPAREGGAMRVTVHNLESRAADAGMGAGERGFALALPPDAAASRVLQPEARPRVPRGG